MTDENEEKRVIQIVIRESDPYVSDIDITVDNIMYWLKQDLNYFGFEIKEVED